MEHLGDSNLIEVRTLNEGCIYHYTSVQALHGILDYGEFWATNSGFLNDKTEFNYTYKLFEEYILNRIRNTVFREKIINAFRIKVEKNRSLPCLTGTLYGKYVISFSTCPDNLLLWTEFSNSMGYNIGFDFNNLLKSFENKVVFHGEVIYDRDEQLCCLQKALDYLLTWRPDCYFVKSINDFNEHTSDTTISYLALDMEFFCGIYSMFFKQLFFAPEKEYRFIFNAIHEKNEHVRKTTKLHFRVKDDVLIPYIQVPFRPYNALHSITIGPKNNIDIAEAGIKCYCREKRIEVPVRKSNIPLRY